MFAAHQYELAIARPQLSRMPSCCARAAYASGTRSELLLRAQNMAGQREIRLPRQMQIVDHTVRGNQRVEIDVAEPVRMSGAKLPYACVIKASAPDKALLGCAARIAV